MKTNESTLDRGIRGVLGIALLAGAVALAGGARIALGVVGVVALGTAVIGFCPLYTLIGINTCARR